MADSHKTVASRIGDVVVLLISVAILAAGYVAWKVYEAGPARNAYDMAAGVYEETVQNVGPVRQSAESVIENCAARSGLEAQCAALQAAYDATASMEPAKKFSRLTSKDTFAKETEALEARNAELNQAIGAFQDNTAAIQEAILARIIEKVGPARNPMLEQVKIAEGQIDTCRDVLAGTEGQFVDASVRQGAQASIDSLQGLVDQANALLSENPEDYTALAGQLSSQTAQLTDWTNQVNLDHWDWATRHGVGQVYNPADNPTENLAH